MPAAGPAPVAAAAVEDAPVEVSHSYPQEKNLFLIGVRVCV